MQCCKSTGRLIKSAGLVIASTTLFFSTTLQDECSGAMLPLLQVSPVIAAANNPYSWLYYWQNNNIGLVASHEDNLAQLYNNAIAAMAFILNKDFKRAERILDYFNGRMDDTEFTVNGVASGFYQYRDSTSGLPATNTDRWFGDNAFLLMAINYYKKTTGKNTYDSMGADIAAWLISLQNADGSVGSKHTEGNIDAYAALKGHGNLVAANKIKAWLDIAPNQNWENGPLDIHSWRVLSLGGDYGFCLNDTTGCQRTIINFGKTIRGFVALPDRSDNIWVEGTGQMVMAFYAAGYQQQGDDYFNELKKTSIYSKQPRMKTFPFLVLADPVDTWADPKKGHIAGVVWYLFAEKQFNPFYGETVPAGTVKQNPVLRIQAENHIGTTGEVRYDGAGSPLEGNAIHIAGDDDTLIYNCSAPNPPSPCCSTAPCLSTADYVFDSLEAIPAAKISVRYADEAGGDVCNISIDSQPKYTFTTDDTGTWSDYIDSEPAEISSIAKGSHTMQIACEDKGTYGVTIDAVNILQ